MNALTSRGTWVPLIGVGVVSIDDWDHEISDWAVENTPVFGSTEDAIEASDNLKTVTTVAMVGTALAVPNGEGAWEWKPERAHRATRRSATTTASPDSRQSQRILALRRPRYETGEKSGLEFEPETDADEPRVGVGARFVAVVREVPQE